MNDIRVRKATKASKTGKEKLQPVSKIRVVFFFLGIILVLCVLSYFVLGIASSTGNVMIRHDGASSTPAALVIPPTLDITDYDTRMLYLAHKLILTTASGTSKLIPNPELATTTSTTTKKVISSADLGWDSSNWPAKNAAYPIPGAILPFKRIVAFYGNLYSTKMGVLGEYDPAVVLSKLQDKVHEWEAADPHTPVVPALHYIAVVAQGSAGADGMYRARMPDSEIEKVLQMAKDSNALVFLDVQVGKSTLQKELPQLKKYLELPNVELGIDPEFSMKFGDKPGSVIGTFDAADINYAASFLAQIVKDKNIPPKVLTFYRFTQKMITNTENMKTLPEVQMVLVMDGWGGEAHKIQTYKSFVYPYPIQFTGFKLFFKNDFKNPGSKILTPEQVLKVTPAPSYIQYQ